MAAEDSNGLVIAAVADLVRRKDQGLDDLPGSLVALLQQGTWRRFNAGSPGDPRVYGEHDFGRFVQARWPDGLGASVELLERIAKGTKAEVPLREALKRKSGRKAHAEPHNNVMRIQQGNRSDYTLARLQRDYPELAARVKAHELTANAAAIQAGFRKPTTTVPVDSAQGAIAALLRRFERDELQEALDQSSAGLIGDADDRAETSHKQDARGRCANTGLGHNPHLECERSSKYAQDQDRRR